MGKNWLNGTWMVLLKSWKGTLMDSGETFNDVGRNIGRCTEQFDRFQVFMGKNWVNGTWMVLLISWKGTLMDLGDTLKDERTG